MKKYNGEPLHWDKTSHIKVYIPKSNYTPLMKQAFSAWTKATKGRVTFSYVYNKDLAQDVVEFIDRFNEGSVVGLASAPTSVYKTRSGDEYHRLKQIKITVADHTTTGKPMDRDQIYTVMLHEIGHSLGLPHTNDKASIMYPSCYDYKTQEISNLELDKLSEIYGWK